MLIRSWYCSIFKELFVLAFRGSFSAFALPSVIGRLNYYSTACRFCQEVFQNFFQIFELFFPFRLLPRPLSRELFYFITFFDDCQGVFENFLYFFKLTFFIFIIKCFDSFERTKSKEPNLMSY